MSWAIGYDSRWQRDIGYGVPAYCDHPKCMAEIDRGLGYVCCDAEPYGGEKGCGLYFCREHHDYRQRCKACVKGYKKPYRPSPEHPAWVKHKLTDPSWKQWRKENPAEVEALKRR